MGGAFALQAQETPDFEVKILETDEPMQTGRFEPNWQSMHQYQVPEWFKNAKFGIWAHWGPQCVEGSGDWMARGMYQEGSGAYKHHVENYGHPSEVGFKDILPLFKAENWQPDSLVAYYKSLGAQYFFALGNHHDNFDLWDSKYQPWNSKNIGSKRDILAEWEKASRKYGLPFGISFHADHAWTWYEPSRRYDLKGDKVGEPYDGNLTMADGKGKWWEGLDPQQLYRQDHPMSKGSWSNDMPDQWEWGNGASHPSVEFATEFYNRTLDAIRRYKPDVIYFDATILPFYPVSDAGMKILAHYYNATDGKGVALGKILPEDIRDCLVWDVERGAPNFIVPQTWQTCTCIGGWHYNQSIYDRDRYKSASTIARMLVDIVSKNGNLLLSVPLRGDGTFDEKEKKILDEFGAWMNINKEAIYDTRPWHKFGEGPIAESDIKLKDQGFNEGSYAEAGANEVRFTTKGKTIYAMPLAWPEDGKVTIRSLADKKVKSVKLLGYGKVKHHRTAEGLVVELPAPLNGIFPVLEVK